MRCEICGINYDVGKCIVCGKYICSEKHAELLWIGLDVNTDSGHYLESGRYSITLYCCLEEHSSKEVQKFIQNQYGDIAKIIKYKKTEEEMEYTLKIVLVGSTFTGKTTMLKRYLFNEFDPETKLTIGVDFLTKKLQLFNKNIKLQLWDTGGVKRDEFLLPTYYSGLDCLIIVFDPTRALSITNLQNFIDLALKADLKSSQIVLVGNKSDLTDQIVIPDELALRLVEEYNLGSYVKTSAKTGSNINYAFELATVIAMAKRELISESELKLYIAQPERESN